MRWVSNSVEPAVRRRTDGLELRDRVAVGSLPRFREHVGVGDAFAFLHRDDLPRAHVRGEQIGPRFDHVDAEDRPPRPAEQDDLVLAEPAPEPFGELDAVLRHPLDREIGRDGAPRGAESSAGAGLVPLHDREVALPRNECGRQPGDRRARAAVEHENDRVVAILAADRDPLRRAADLDEQSVVDAVRRRDPHELLALVLAPGAIAEPGADNERDEDDER